MQFSMKQAALAAALAQIGGIAARKVATTPILGNVFLILKGNELTLMTSDLELFAKTIVEVEGKQDGQTTVNAAKLSALVKAMPSAADVQFKLSAKESAQLTSGRSRFKLNTLPASDYPEPKTADGDSHSVLSLPSTMVASLFDRVQRSMANNDARHFLNGVLIELSDSTLKLVSTDGHRLSLAEREVEHDQKPVSVILPRKGSVEFLKLAKAVDGDVRLGLSKNNVILSTDSSRIMSQAIDGKFPDYNAVLPQAVTKPAVVDRSSLAAAIERVAITSHEKNHTVRVDLKPGSIALSTDSGGSGSGEDSIDAEFEGDSLKIGFNLLYVRDALSSIGSESVEVHVKDGNSAALILPCDKSESSRYVVMPLKV